MFFPHNNQITFAAKVQLFASYRFQARRSLSCYNVINIKIMLILPKYIQLRHQTFAYMKEKHYLCSQIKFALLGLGCPRSEKGCHRQLFFISPLGRLSCHTSCHPPDKYSFSRHRMPSSLRLD